MGNLCISDDSDRAYQDYLYKKHKCFKCKDMFTLHKNNNRLHCRIHRVNINNICIDCGVYIYKNKHMNCHHVKEKKWHYFLFK